MGGAEQLVTIALVIVFWVFVVSRSAAFRSRRVLKHIEPGDKLATFSGITGILVAKSKKYFKLEIAPGVVVEIENAKVAKRLEKDVGISVQSRPQPTPGKPPRPVDKTGEVPVRPHQPRPAPPPSRDKTVCVKCGASRKPGDRFCASCGAPFS